MLNAFLAFFRRGYSSFQLVRMTAVTVGLVFAASLSALADNLLENPGFENDMKGWIAAPPDTSVFKAVPEAAAIGKMGLRVTPGDVAASLTTPPFQAVPRHVYRFTSWVRLNGGRAPQISIEFQGSGGAVLPPVAYPGFWTTFVPKEEGQFNATSLQAIAPDGAVSVSIRIQAPRVPGSVTGSTDVDDCLLEDIPIDAAKKTPLPPQLSDAEIQALLTEIKADPTRGQPPPMIVLKLDDFGLAGLSHGPDMVKDVGHAWGRIEDFVEKRKIKVSIGIVAKSLEICGQPFIDWMKKMHDTGLVEFWYHGYDHAGWTDPQGKVHSEFVARSYDEQKQHFDMSQKLMLDKVGFPLTSFGPPGGPPDTHTDAVTNQVMQDDKYMTSWMYGGPLDPLGKALASEGKVVILDRVWSVNTEAFVGHPRFDIFLQGYAHNRGRAYFVLQGHPPIWGWNEANYNEFTKMVDFLQSQGAVFMTPTECAAAVKNGTHGAAQAAAAPPVSGSVQAPTPAPAAP